MQNRPIADAHKTTRTEFTALFGSAKLVPEADLSKSRFWSGDNRNLKARFLAQVQAQATPRAVGHVQIPGVELGQ